MHMPEQPIAFDRLKERLLRVGVAPAHVRRLISELHDHYDDAVRDEIAKGRPTEQARLNAWTRLGREDDVVGSIAARPELQSLPARFPGLVFGLGPLVLWFAAFMLTGMTLHAVRLFPPQDAFDQASLRAVAYGAFFFYGHILPLIIGAGVMVAAAQQRIALRWPAVGAVTISLIAAMTSMDIKFAEHAGEKGNLSIGIGVTADQLPQTLAMTALYAGLLILPYMAWMRRRSAT
jgi:hypothetical protein